MSATISEGMARCGQDRVFAIAALAWTRSTTSESRSTMPTVWVFPMTNVPTLKGSRLLAAVPAWANAEIGTVSSAASASTRTRGIGPPSKTGTKRLLGTLPADESQRVRPQSDARVRFDGCVWVDHEVPRSVADERYFSAKQ